eukprot:TRINITY_DN3066_c0_g1_i2.p1 TRINITY_DN3066_c0_g1~~TRINITY_DN3066_c0_g1_i2.p1  ORF type:complete len:592 (+),score=144.09 TRINITY_DN3066_c0_g1_i2:1781-3556(+)
MSSLNNTINNNNNNNNNNAKVNIMPTDMSVPKSEWISRVMRKHPAVIELHERLRPVTGQSTFGRAKTIGKTEVSEVLSDEVMDMLVMQFLAEERLTTTLTTLENESHSKYIPGNIEPESLQTLLRMGIQDTKTIFDAIIAGSNDYSEDTIDPEVPSLRHYNMGGAGEEDVDLWQEANASENIQMVNGAVVAASINHLIIHLTMNPPDIDFRKVFLMTHSSFLNSERFLNKLIERYEVPEDLATKIPAEYAEVYKRDKSLVFAVIKNWAEQYPYDFSEKVIAILSGFIDSHREDDLDVTKQLVTIINKIEEHKGTSSTSISADIVGREPPEPKVPRNIFSSTLSLDDVDEEEIARQLCMLDFDLYKAIRPSELLLKSWELHKGRAPNVITAIRRLNDLAKWVSGTILHEKRQFEIQQMELSKTGKTFKFKVLPRLLRISEHLKTLNNYFSLSAIYSGIFNNEIFPIVKMQVQNHHQLTKMQDSLHDLERLFSDQGSFKTYRTSFNNAKPPCIPLLGVHLRDIAFIEDCNPDKINGLINFEKRQRLWKAINSFTIYQPIPYIFYRVHQVVVFLKDLKIGTEDSAEPQDNSDDY